MNNSKWTILFIFIFLYLIGIGGAAWHTYEATDPSKAVPTVESLKIIFIMLGGLGVILPTYLNVWQSLETARLLEDQTKRNIIENTFRLLEKWDDTSLFEARKFTRELKDNQNNLSPDQLKQWIKDKPELRQSVIILFNCFDLIRISIEQDRIDEGIIKDAIGEVFLDMYGRFKPWIKEQSQSSQKDTEKLVNLLHK